jgi:penicillin G amidase
VADNPWATALRAAAEAAVPRVEGDLPVPGLDGEVEVARDRWGVPHIYATTLHDLFLAQGFVQASERLWQIEFLFRLGTGRLSELFSELTLPMDRFIRTVGWNRAARRQAERWDDRSQEMTRAFGDGIRAWLELMPAPPVEYRVLDVEPAPLTDEDDAYLGAAAAVFMAWGLSRNWDHELLRAEVAERLGVETMRMLFPDLDTEAGVVEAGKEGGFDRMALLRDAILPPAGQGSNNWVVDGTRTRTGKPLLANDPHLAISVPSIWFEVHLTGPGIDVAGVALPFSPGVLIGHNDRIAWGFTNSEADVQDLYLERLNEDQTAAEYLGSWDPLTVHREVIRVRGRDEPEVVEVRETRHGPLLDSYTIGIAEPSVVQGGIRRSYALRWVGAEHGIQPSTVFNLNTAGSWEDFRAAVHDAWVCPGQNMVYADVDGNIGYQLTGLYPIRRQGDGTVPVPGWTDEYEWEGWIPFDDLPRAFNPKDGFACTANNKMHDEGYPYLLGRDFLPPFRARRIAQMITARETHDRGTFAEMQVDTRLLPAADIVPHLVAVEPGDDRQKAAIALLADWDHDAAAGSAAAALYELWCHHLARRLLRPLLGEDLFLHFYGRRQWTNAFQYQVLPNLLAYPTARWFGRNGAEARDRTILEALDGALDDLTTRLGDDPDGWRWGALHRARFAGRLAILGGLEDLFSAGEVELGGDEQTVLQGKYEPEWSYEAVVIPSWRQILDPSDWDASVGTIPVGQSGHPASPHFADLLPLWAAGEHHPMPFTRRAVDEATDSTLLLRPGADER